MHQLRQLGYSKSSIETQVSRGALHRVLRGVYAVGHGGIGRHGLMHSAVLACGRGALISRRSAAELLGLSDVQPVLTDLSGPSQAGRKIPGIRWHESTGIERTEVVVREGIPCTSVARTLVDMAGCCGARTLRRLVEEAAVSGLLDVFAVDRVLVRRRRRGAAVLRWVLDPWRRLGSEFPRLRSALEARVLSAILEEKLPMPETNVTLGVDDEYLEVDFLWREQRVVIETDGQRTHGTGVAFRRDRRRDQVLAAAGFRTARITWSHLEDEPRETMARIRRMLEVGT